MYLYQRFRMVITPNRDLWNTITIVITLDSMHENFDTTNASLLKAGNKTIDQIQSILQLKEAKNLSKQASGDTSNLAMAFRDKRPKMKANSNNKCYNYYKLGHFKSDCFLLDRRLNRTTQQSRRKKLQRGDSHRRKSEVQSHTPN